MLLLLWHLKSVPLAEYQNGVNVVQRCSTESQYGANAIDVVQDSTLLVLTREF